MPKVVQLVFEVNFKPAKKTTANGSGRHDWPPGWQVAKLARANVASRTSVRHGCSAGSGDVAGSDTQMNQ
jgi:hypothetical protein